MDVKQIIVDNLKNTLGWKTKRKIIVLSIDDYGNVRLDSKQSRENLDAAGFVSKSRFDSLDTLETKQDLEMLFEVLCSVRDINGRNAVISAFALPCNIDFERMADEKNKEYRHEILPITFKKLSVLQPKAYVGAWDLWQEGIANKIMLPHFHGREHLNLKLFNSKLKNQDVDILTALKNRSYTSISVDKYQVKSYTAAFDFWDIEETASYDEIINSGLKNFENVFGYPSNYFNAPGNSASKRIEPFLLENGIKFTDNPIVKSEHCGRGLYKKSFNYTGKRLASGLVNITRNVVFEPGANTFQGSLGSALKQIESAFFWNKPAIISSHRVNFCGHIDPKNRQKGLSDLKMLLQETVKRWPEVEFMAANELGELIYI
jgi:hypothetical protein